MAITVMICLLFFAKLLYWTPLAILASIILFALPGLIDLNEAHNIWKVDKLDFMVCLAAFFGILFGSVEIGLLVAVVISFGKIMVSSIKPSTEVPGRLPGTDLFCNILQYPVATKISGILITRINSGTICFANSGFILERILRSATDEKNIQESSKRRLHVLVLDLTNYNDEEYKRRGVSDEIRSQILDLVNHLLAAWEDVMNIDTSGINALEELRQKLVARGIQLALVNPRWQVITKMKAAKFVEKIGAEWVFLSMFDAVDASLTPKMNGLNSC